MKHAFQAAGYNPNEYEFGAAVSKYLAAGGTVALAHEIVDTAAKRMPGKGQFALAEGQSQVLGAPTRQPVEGSGRAGRVNQSDQNSCAAPSSHREPSTAQRRAASSVRNVIALTVLDSYKVRDGRAIGDVRIGELERMRTANSREAAVIRQIQRIGVADHDMRVRDVVKAEEMQKMIQRAAEIADAS